VSAGPSPVRVWAFAKINLALEVLGKRDDGYHELRTVLQTISLADCIDLSAPVAADSLRMQGDGLAELPSPADNIVSAALAAYRSASDGFPGESGVSIALQKRIPVAAGLGGGSADGAAVLRALDALNPRPLGVAALEELATTFGSDTAFFVRGGTQLARGRGEQLTSITDWSPRWFVLLPRADAGPRKTAKLFSLLRPSHFSDGRRAEAAATALSQRPWFDAPQFVNTFERVEADAFPNIAPARAAMLRVCGQALLSGAGPSLFALAPDERTARRWAQQLGDAWSVLVVRSVGSREAGTLQRSSGDATSV
jgi:4-diphosphocytidyl-2-C-methyl-D-erythritol kinase